MQKIEDILAQFTYRNVEKDEDYDHELNQKEIIEKTIMPPFFTFPEPTPVFTINVNNHNNLITITVLDDEGQPVGGTFSDIEKAYDYVKKDLRGDTIFAGDIEAVTGRKLGGIVILPKTKGQKGSRMLSSHTSYKAEWLAKSSYLNWLEETLHYEANPNDLLVCYYWLNSHPAFWYRSAADSDRWITDNGNSHVTLDIGSNEEGTYIMLEHGAAVEPERTMHYHDFRLDVYAPTFEEAYIQLAALVHKFFNIDGTERENVEYTKSAEELQLEEIIKRYDAENEEDE